MNHFFLFVTMSGNFPKFWLKSVKFETYHKNKKWFLKITKEILFSGWDVFFILYHFWHLIVKNRHVARLFLTHPEDASINKCEICWFFKIRCQKSYKKQKKSCDLKKISHIWFLKTIFHLERKVWNLLDFCQNFETFLGIHRNRKKWLIKMVTRAFFNQTQNALWGYSDRAFLYFKNLK